MNFNKTIIGANFIKRPNRFEAYVSINGIDELVHVPNTGRCKEILIAGSRVLLRQEDNPKRKSKYDLIAAYKNHRLINIDSQIPNKVVEEALKKKNIDKLIKYTNIQREKTFGNSRFDFKLMDNNNNVYYLEVKGVTFEENNIAKFPDAPTERGRKHIIELIEAKKQGYGAGILFLIQMNGAIKFRPYDEIDEEFGRVLRLAFKKGVNIFAYECEVKEESISLTRPLEIEL
ncbi:DNA/RNA nuclease SfsA [Haloimpatiens sp. FM7315]|uniref:DNA/RNA nuclease SfsA n=1 Tax=Haloimpatiens sp. FM7315 TaxID=3298609 RepID=UPI003709F4FF